MAENKELEKTVVPKKEVSNVTVAAYATTKGGGYMLIQATIASYFSIFMTDTVGIAAGAASIISLIASLAAAFCDPVIGGICDRMNTRWGRFRPYFLFVPIPYVLLSFLLFLNPSGLGATGTVVYMGVVYVIYGVVNTLITMPSDAIVTTLTKNDQERSNLIQLGTVLVAVSFTIASSFTTNFVSVLGSYSTLILIYGVLMLISCFTLFATSQERYVSVSKEKRSIGDDLKVIGRHIKPLGNVMLVWLLASLGYGLMFSSSVYYITYYQMRPDLITPYMLALSIGALISMMFLMPIMLRLFKFAYKALLITQAISFVCYFILFIYGKNMTLLFVLSFIAAAVSSMQQGLVGFLLNDTIDYIQLKEHIGMNGMLSSIKGFAYKCGNTVVTAGMMGILAVTGYVAGAVGGQPDSAMFALNLIRFGIPSVICILIVILLIFYPFKKYYWAFAKMKEEMQESGR